MRGLIVATTCVLGASLAGPAMLAAQEPGPSAVTTTTTTTTTPSPAPTTTTTTPTEAPPARRVPPKSGGVTIADFSFTPSSISITAGDSVTWTNQGPTDHTATAADGSFDSGTLAAGQSYTHTFTQAGTYSYLCSFHPDMKGAVVVSDPSGGGSGSGGGGTSGSTGPTTSTPVAGTTAAPLSESAAGTLPDAAGTATGLPSTGQPAVPLVLAGIVLLAAGVLIRRRQAPPSD